MLLKSILFFSILLLATGQTKADCGFILYETPTGCEPCPQGQMFFKTTNACGCPKFTNENCRDIGAAVCWFATLWNRSGCIQVCAAWEYVDQLGNCVQGCPRNSMIDWFAPLDNDGTRIIVDIFCKECCTELDKQCVMINRNARCVPGCKADEKININGSCEKCAANLVLREDQRSCVCTVRRPNAAGVLCNCPLDREDINGICTCKLGKVGLTPTAVCTTCPEPRIPNDDRDACICRSDRTDIDGTCTCNPGTVGLTPTAACTTCPEPRIPNDARNACVCPPDREDINGICRCKPGTIGLTSTEVCTPCPEPRVPNVSRIACVCPPDRTEIDGTCTCYPGTVGATSTSVCTPCPEQRIPNEARTACVCTPHREDINGTCICILGTVGLTPTAECTTCTAPMIPNDARDCCVCPLGQGANYFDQIICNENSWFRNADGGCNNPIYVWWGRAFTPCQDHPPSFDDDARSLSSNNSFAVKPYTNDDKSINHMLPFFSQYIMNDILKASPTSEKYQNRHQIQTRVRTQNSSCYYGYREQVNEATAWLDQSPTYGNSVMQQQRLRSFEYGKLGTSAAYAGQQDKFSFMPINCDAASDFQLLVKRGVCFQTGDERANENPLLAAIHTIFMRLHNSIVDHLHALNPIWADKLLFQEGRRIANAIYQNIVFAEWLPLVIGDAHYKAAGVAPFKSSKVSSDYSPDGYFTKYDPYVMPSVAVKFAAEAGQLGHALVRSRISKVDIKFNVVDQLSMSDCVFNPGLLLTEDGEGIDELMRGCLKDVANINSPQDHGKYKTTRFHSMPAHTTSQERAIDLQSYNSNRELAGLNWARTFDELTWIEPKKIERLKEMYPSVHTIDLYTGAMSETRVPGGLVGPTFAQFIASGFKNLKQGDKFYFENSPRDSTHPFTPAQLASIRSVKLSSVLCETLRLEKVPAKAFLAPDKHSNPFVRCRSLPQVDFGLFIDE